MPPKWTEDRGQHGKLCVTSELERRYDLVLKRTDRLATIAKEGLPVSVTDINEAIVV